MKVEQEGIFLLLIPWWFIFFCEAAWVGLFVALPQNTMVAFKQNLSLDEFGDSKSVTVQ